MRRDGKRVWRAALVACTFGAVFPPGVGRAAAQAKAAEEPASYREALVALADGDTLAATRSLREATRAAPRFGPAFLRLGAVLGRRASEVERDYELRLEARGALERAAELLPDDPEVFLEYGLLLRKQQIRVDAKRALDRAWSLAERKAGSLSPARRAELQYQLARIYESWWEDWQNLVQVPETAERVTCAALGGAAAAHWDAAVACPVQWADQLPQVIPLADLKDEERERMLEHYRRALEADSSHVGAAVGLLGHLADAGAWGEYERVARRLVGAAPDDARSHLFLGLGLHERGRDVAADSAFSRALALLPPAERRVFDDVAELLPARTRDRYASLDSAGRAETARLLFTAKDPLFLTEPEERRLEHYARLAWAELKFGAPASGLRGWESDRGRIWVRYGPPWRWYQCCYGISYVTNGQQGLPDLESADAAAQPSAEPSAVRFVYWSYGPEGPVFVFRKPLTYKRARFTDGAQRLAEELAKTAPELYRPRTVASIHDLPHQVVRFRGSRPDLTLVEVHAAPPLDSLGAERGDSLEAGFFLFDDGYRPAWSRRHRVGVGDHAVGLTYRLELLPGAYRYGVEARASGPDTLPRPAARAREALEVAGFPADRLSLSDLLLADGIRARVPSPRTRDDLMIAPSRTLRIEAGRALHLYFEVYGLRVDGDSLGRYRAELAVEDSTRRNLVERIARGVEELFRRDGAAPRVAWERTAPVVDGAAIDYLSIELPTLDAGEYVVRLKLTDAVTGESAEAVRRFRVEPPWDPGGGP